jgi:pilus assembly protein Flp/PilA
LSHVGRDIATSCSTIDESSLNSVKERRFRWKDVRFLKEEDGVTAIEYGLIAALIAIAIIAALIAVGGGLNTIFNRVVTALTTGA